MSYNNDIAAEAWNATKAKDEPLWPDVNFAYREKLSTHAESVARVGLPENPTEFEKCVKDLLDHPEKARAAIVKTKEEAAKAAAATMVEAGKRHVKEVDVQVAAEKKALEDEKKTEKDKTTAADRTASRLKGTGVPLATEPQTGTSVAPQSTRATAPTSSSDSVRQGRLADDFPHRAALEAAGINTYGQARKAHESGWADVHGIGEARASEIGDALKD